MTNFPAGTVDRVSELPFAEQLMLWAIRLWVRGRRQGICVDSQLVQGLSRARIPAGPLLIEQLMMAIVHGHRRQVEIHCTCYGNLSQDEKRLLEALTLSQRGERGVAEELLGDLLEGQGRVRVAAIMIQLSQRLGEAGLELVGLETLSLRLPRNRYVMPVAAGLH